MLRTWRPPWAKGTLRVLNEPLPAVQRPPRALLATPCATPAQVHAFARANGGAVLASADLVPLQREHPALFNELSSRLNAYLKPGISVEPISLSKLSVVR